ncbi:MAG: DASH complex subunit dam1 [Alectoria fallacina]|uniref:DASH complex subunit DAM1 n=1 Tax=Alectoria fallacina TaxID=1903189 RepID=A0A8H3IS33_9LECA|nr:MAG: DASH complex subunit dam1 [Alectoria fallacina]
MDFPNPKLSTSASRHMPPSRPSTPLRPSSRISLRDSQTFTPKTGSLVFPLECLEPAFAELSDSMADLEANFMHLQLMHESLSRFNESFASFLYGMNMNAFCVDFPEAPIADSFKRAKQNEEHGQSTDHVSRPDFGDETFMTTDTSFVENPPSSRAPTNFATPAPIARPSSELNKRAGGETRPRGGKAGAARGNLKGSGIARGKPRGTR